MVQGLVEIAVAVVTASGALGVAFIAKFQGKKIGGNDLPTEKPKLYCDVQTFEHLKTREAIRDGFDDIQVCLNRIIELQEEKAR